MPVQHPIPVLVQEASSDTSVLLVHAPYPGRLKFDGQPSSLLSAASILVDELERADRLPEVGFLDPRAPSVSFYKALESLAAGGMLRVACISTSTAAIEEAAHIAQVLRDAAGSDLLIAAGGPHEDDSPVPMAHRIPEVDISIGGDAEEALAVVVLAFLRCRRSANAFVPSIQSLLSRKTLRGRGRVASGGKKDWTWRSPVDMPIEQLLARPWVNRDVSFSVFAGRKTLPVMVSRGCSYGRCTFCAEASGARQRVVEDFLPLLRLVEDHAGAAIYFQDSIFPTTPSVRTRLLPLLREVGRPWGCQVYLPTLSRSFVRLLAEHGCTYVYTGVESGAQDLRAALGKPGLRDSLVRTRLLWLAEEGLRVGLSLMFGALRPDGSLAESEASVACTLTFAQQCLDDGVIIEGFYPNVMTVLPGTAVAAGLARAGVNLDFYRMPRVPQFADLEDGGVGYNFSSIPSAAGKSERLVRSVRDAAATLSLEGRRGLPDGDRACAHSRSPERGRLGRVGDRRQGL